ncbi:MAG TPA: tetratricopeptide repeat protein, partial [Candidatus Ozemobacteraceae bacterium]|nr:tetratricopeptide repeat protein [Candidatus Ozemobacteraceae bacterium]
MLEQIDLFSSLSTKELRDIEQIALTRSVLRGEVIFSQGDFARDLFLVQNGQVEILLKDYKQDLKQVAVMRNGDFFGEMALFDKDSVRSATARALQNSTLIIIPGTGFERLLQEKPSISFKLLNALSKRLKDTSQKAVAGSSSIVTAGTPTEARIITVASPRNGTGKSIFATTLAQILAHETSRRVLLIDLDFSFADSTYLLGIVSPKSVIEMCQLVEKGEQAWETLSRGLVRHAESFFSLPAPNNIVDGEKIRPGILISMVKALRKFFDYIILDTDSPINENLLNAIDLADRVIFLVNLETVRMIKGATRYFQGLGKLDYNEDRFCLFAHRGGSEFQPERYRSLFRFPLYGALANLDCTGIDYGKTAYQLQPNCAYCHSLRQIIRSLLKEQVRAPQTETNKGFFFRLFYDESKPQTNDASASEQLLESQGGKKQTSPKILESDLSALLKYIRTNVLYGNLEEAREQTQQLLTYCNWSASIFQILGEIHYGEHNFSQAIDVLKQAIHLDPENYMAMGFLAEITNDDALFKKAVNLVESQIGEKTRYPDLYNDLGRLWELHRDWQKAVDNYHKALALNPQYLEAKMHLATVLGKQELFHEAIQVLEEIHPKNIRVFYMLGDYYYSVGQFAESKVNFLSAEEINPNYYDLTTRLKHLEDYFDRLVSLIEMHQKIIKDHPNYPDIHLKLGNFYTLLGQRDEAVEEFRRALAINPNYQEAKTQLETWMKGDNLLPHTTSLPATAAPTGFALSLTFPCSLGKENPTGCPTNCTLTVRNLRTSRSAEIDMPCKHNKGETATTVDISALGPISRGDILLVKIKNRTTGKSSLALPHPVSEDEVKSRDVVISLENGALDETEGPQTPIRYFFVRTRNAVLAQTLSRAPQSTKIVLENPRLPLRAVGQLNADDPTEVTFVLKSPRGREVVQVGDTLR